MSFCVIFTFPIVIPYINLYRTISLTNFDYCVLQPLPQNKMASHTQGIQQLLAAEKRAAEKVSDAKKRKARRLKQAKEEAQEEIEKYRLEREKQFKDFEAKHMGSRENVASRIEGDTKTKIDEMTKQVNVNKEAVIKKILELVSDIKPELHKNFKAIK